jgi:hypothetical protein
LSLKELMKRLIGEAGVGAVPVAAFPLLPREKSEDTPPEGEAPLMGGVLTLFSREPRPGLAVMAVGVVGVVLVVDTVILVEVEAET